MNELEGQFKKLQEDYKELRKDFDELKDVYYRNNFTSKQIITKDIEFKGKVNINTGIGLFGTTPVVVQPSTIADPTGGSTVDGQARSSISSILTILKKYGIIKSS